MVSGEQPFHLLHRPQVSACGLVPDSRSHLLGHSNLGFISCFYKKFYALLNTVSLTETKLENVVSAT